jgi:hypothetical protein
MIPTHLPRRNPPTVLNNAGAMHVEAGHPTFGLPFYQARILCMRPLVFPPPMSYKLNTSSHVYISLSLTLTPIKPNQTTVGGTGHPTPLSLSLTHTSTKLKPNHSDLSYINQITSNLSLSL